MTSNLNYHVYQALKAIEISMPSGPAGECDFIRNPVINLSVAICILHDKKSHQNF